MKKSLGGRKLNLKYVAERTSYFDEVISNSLHKSYDCLIEREETEYYTMKAMIAYDIIVRENSYYPKA